MDFEKRLKTRLYVSLSYIVIGALLCALYLAKVFEGEYVLTLSTLLAVMGILRLFMYLKTVKTPEAKRRQKIAESDERNLSIIHKARSSAFLLYTLITALAVRALEILKKSEVASILALNVCSIIIIYWICYFIYKKKM